jgi:hypothetical protein
MASWTMMGLKVRVRAKQEQEIERSGSAHG